MAETTDLSKIAGRDFLQRLQREAALQATVTQRRWLPSSVDWLTAIVGRYSWQVCLVLSFISAILVQLWRIHG